MSNPQQSMQTLKQREPNRSPYLVSSSNQYGKWVMRIFLVHVHLSSTYILVLFLPWHTLQASFNRTFISRFIFFFKCRNPFSTQETLQHALKDPSITCQKHRYYHHHHHRKARYSHFEQHLLKWIMQWVIIKVLISTPHFRPCFNQSAKFFRKLN